VQLIAENLTIERGGRTIVQSVFFAVPAAQALILVGRNGAGKTTLLRALAGLLRPVAGSMKLDGGNDELTVGEQAHFVGHANAVKANLTVRENVDFWARYLGGHDGAETRIANALSTFALTDLSEFPAAYLSAGQKRRLGLARLLLAARPVWLLDEPNVSLDAASTAILSAAVNAHLRAGGIVVAATHLPLGFESAREFNVAAMSGREAA